MLKSDMVMSFLGLLAGEDEGLLLDVRVGHPNFASSFLFTDFAVLLPMGPLQLKNNKIILLF